MSEKLYTEAELRSIAEAAIDIAETVDSLRNNGIIHVDTNYETLYQDMVTWAIEFSSAYGPCDSESDDYLDRVFSFAKERVLSKYGAGMEAARHLIKATGLPGCIPLSEGAGEDLIAKATFYRKMINDLESFAAKRLYMEESGYVSSALLGDVYVFQRMGDILNLIASEASVFTGPQISKMLAAGVTLYDLYAGWYNSNTEAPTVENLKAFATELEAGHISLEHSNTEDEVITAKNPLNARIGCPQYVVIKQIESTNYYAEVSEVHSAASMQEAYQIMVKAYAERMQEAYDDQERIGTEADIGCPFCGDNEAFIAVGDDHNHTRIRWAIFRLENGPERGD